MLALGCLTWRGLHPWMMTGTVFKCKLVTGHLHPNLQANMEEAEAAHKAQLEEMTAASEALQAQIDQQQDTIQELRTTQQELEATIAEIQAEHSEYTTFS
jgi:septal ring factor EnvC (AmiA/AmiB activator)